MNAISEKQFGEAEKQFKQFEAMINSMTPAERSNPDLLAKVWALLAGPCMHTAHAMALKVFLKAHLHGRLFQGVGCTQ